jgi:hypothetical protein
MAGNVGVTTTDLINEAAALIGVYQGYPLAAGDLQSFFFTLRALIDGWGAQRFTFRQTAIAQFETEVGKQTYTVGPGSGNDWVVSPLPPEFDGMTFILPGSNPVIERELFLCSEAQWRALPIKSLEVGMLWKCWPNLGLTAHELNFFPLPNGAIAVNLYMGTPIAQLAATSTAIVFPPLYQEVVTWELAIKASAKFGASVPQWVFDAWADAKSTIKANTFAENPTDQRVDAALQARRTRGGGSIDFYLGV